MSGDERTRRYANVLVERLNTGELHDTYSMTLQKRITRYQIQSRILNYDSLQAQYSLFTPIPSHRLYETVIELLRYQRKEGRSKVRYQPNLMPAGFYATDLEYLTDH